MGAVRRTLRGESRAADAAALRRDGSPGRLLREARRAAQTGESFRLRAPSGALPPQAPDGPSARSGQDAASGGRRPVPREARRSRAHPSREAGCGGGGKPVTTPRSQPRESILLDLAGIRRGRETDSQLLPALGPQAPDARLPIPQGPSAQGARHTSERLLRRRPGQRLGCRLHGSGLPGRRRLRPEGRQLAGSSASISGRACDGATGGTRQSTDASHTLPSTWRYRSRPSRRPVRPGLRVRPSHAVQGRLRGMPAGNHADDRGHETGNGSRVH